MCRASLGRSYSVGFLDDPGQIKLEFQPTRYNTARSNACGSTFNDIRARGQPAMHCVVPTYAADRLLPVWPAFRTCAFVFELHSCLLCSSVLYLLGYKKSYTRNVSCAYSATPIHGDSAMPWHVHRVEAQRLEHYHSGILPFLRTHQWQKISIHMSTASKTLGSSKRGKWCE